MYEPPQANKPTYILVPRLARGDSRLTQAESAVNSIHAESRRESQQQHQDMNARHSIRAGSMEGAHRESISTNHFGQMKPMTAAQMNRLVSPRTPFPSLVKRIEATCTTPRKRSLPLCTVVSSAASIAFASRLCRPRSLFFVFPFTTPFNTRQYCQLQNHAAGKVQKPLEKEETRGGRIEAGYAPDRSSCPPEACAPRP